MNTKRLVTKLGAVALFCFSVSALAEVKCDLITTQYISGPAVDAPTAKELVQQWAEGKLPNVEIRNGSFVSRVVNVTPLKKEVHSGQSENVAFTGGNDRILAHVFDLNGTYRISMSQSGSEGETIPRASSSGTIGVDGQVSLDLSEPDGSYDYYLICNSDSAIQQVISVLRALVNDL